MRYLCASQTKKKFYPCFIYPKKIFFCGGLSRLPVGSPLFRAIFHSVLNTTREIARSTGRCIHHARHPPFYLEDIVRARDLTVSWCYDTWINTMYTYVYDISQLTIFINNRLSKQFRLDFFLNKNINISNFVINEQNKL